MINQMHETMNIKEEKLFSKMFPLVMFQKDPWFNIWTSEFPPKRLLLFVEKVELEKQLSTISW